MSVVSIHTKLLCLGGAIAAFLVAVHLLRRNRIDAYRYSPEIASDPFARQRLIEGAWPIRHQPGAAVVVSYLAEPNDCRVIAKRAVAGPAGGVRLARCP